MLRQPLEREKIAWIIFSELNNFTDLKPTMITLLSHIKSVTNAGSVGIGLHREGDYPYFVWDGFVESFIEKENSLCARDDRGNRICAEDGASYLLDCMCGNIIRGRFDPSLPFFTAGGSFWSNDTTALLASTTEGERQAHTRNYCNSCGYQSVALIPIKARGMTMGLMQLNDKRTGLFTKDLIEFMEIIGQHIGLAVSNNIMHEELKKALEEAKILREDMHQQAIRDPLTSLFNRRYMEESLKLELKRGERSRYAVGIVMLDIDHLKQANDEFGHAMGDAVLSRVAQLALTSIRASDLACRYAGDEFILILPEICLRDVIKRAEQLREQVKLLRLESPRGRLADVTISLGVAVFPDHGTTGIELLESADRALYRAKQQGRDQVVSAG